MPFAHLTHERIDKMKRAFLNPLVSYNSETRNLLMANISFSYVQRLDKFTSDFNQLAGDLKSLNGLEKLNDGTIPLKIWLQNAKDQFKDLVEVEIFEQAAEEMEAGPAQSFDIDVIIEGIEALWELIRQHPIAFNTVISYRRTFEIALWEIDVIADYKLMHDMLHKLQLHWPDNAVLTLLFSLPNAMRLTLTKDSGSLNDTINSLVDIYGHGYVDGAERKWIDELADEQKNLDAALGDDDEISEGNKSKIGTAYYNVKNQLTKQLSALNTRLKAAINKLHLTDLIDAMGEACDVFRKFAPERASKQVAQYGESIEKLRELDTELSKLLKQHDDWQGADLLLRTLGDSLKKSSDPIQLRGSVQEGEKLTQLKMLHTMIETGIEPLYKERKTFWSNKLKGSAQRFKVQVEDKKNTVLAEQEFDTYRQIAWNFFFELDTEMKEQCEKLRRIGEELRKVNEELKVNYALEDV